MRCVSLVVLVLSSLTVLVASTPIPEPVPVPVPVLDAPEVDAREPTPEAQPDPAGCRTARFSCF
ncbi:hypothetical protein ARMSODRAFT_1020499 [Armillaria solidipes]|uniref:Secreted protein n=2 Tax=Armillaria TaxID=47424 RepID=A0A2H3B9B8_9AGAR|nr:hypothetical protein EV421DRAFT_1898054 [Armillaria borealis]PBK67481.1 hypothetical protein ARMSODRAFT_1020499 [Armillaria solidipes]